MKKAALKKYGLNFCSKKAPEKTDASCCNIQFFICIPSDLVLLAQAHQQPNADLFLPNKILPELLKAFQVIHLCGKGKMDETLKGTEGYVQYEYIKEELPDLFALSDVVISRAGANAICEISALHKPNLLIPLSANASRGDQILNARSFEKQGFSMVLEEEEITDEKLLDTIHQLYDNLSLIHI